VLLAGYVGFIGNTAQYVGGAVASFNAPVWSAEAGAQVELSGNSAQRGSALYLRAVQSDEDPDTARRSRRLDDAALDGGSTAVEVDSFATSQAEGSLPPARRTVPFRGGRRRRLQAASPPPATVTNNHASVGGTVYWLCDSTTGSEPEVLSRTQTFWQNNIAPYGETFATQAVRINATIPTNLTVYGVALRPEPVLTVLDYYNHPLVVDGSVEVQAYVQSPTANQCSGRYPYLSGATTTVRNVGGVVNFTSLRANCAPANAFTMEFKIVPLDLNELTTDAQEAYIMTKTSVLSFRKCRRGEVIKDGECVACAEGTYNLESNITEETRCYECSGKTGVDSCETDMLNLHAGYWRRHSESYSVLECIGSIEGCAGGYAVGDASCEVGYQGPLCGVCADGYYSNNGVCEVCSGSDPQYSTTALVFMAIAGAVLCLLAFLFYAKCIDGGDKLDETGESKKSEYPEYWPSCCTRTWVRKEYNRMQAQLKIVITTYQIVSSIPENMSVTFPASFNVVLNAFSVFNFNIMNTVPFSCSGNYTYIDTLVLKTLFPIALTIVLFVVGGADAAWQTRSLHITDSARFPIVSAVKDQYLTYFFFLTYLVLPSVATTIFQTFLCTNVDPRGEDNDKYDTYLIADMSISCTSDYYYKGVWYAVAMLLVYVVGIPLMYYLLLYYNREELMHRDDVETTRDAATQTNEGRAALVSSKSYAAEALEAAKPKKLSPAVKQLSFLWDAYEPQFWYWEVVETTRRLVLTAVLSVCGSGSSAQSILAVLLGVLYIKLYGFYRPYSQDSDDVVAEVGQFQIFYSFLGALIYQNALLGAQWNNAVAIVLILINAAVTALFTYYGCQTLKEQVEETEQLLFAEKDGEEEESSRVVRQDEGCDTDTTFIAAPVVPPTPRKPSGNESAPFYRAQSDGSYVRVQSGPPPNNSGSYLGALHAMVWGAPAHPPGDAAADADETRSNPTEISYAPVTPRSPVTAGFGMEDDFAYEDDDLCDSRVINNYF
jgi:hypothetical protein